MTNRRDVLTGLAVFGLGATVPSDAGAQPILNDDGLYTQPWFLESFLHLAEDLEAAAAAGKRFAIIWELRGCPYCKDTHLVNFADPEIVRFVQERFEVLQLNITGSREVTDFDGVKLPEKSLAQKYAVRFTPTFQFFPPTGHGLAAKPPRDRQVVRAQGYLPPRQFQAMFHFVAERAYERTTLSDYLKERA
jgi:thioredoxin-related protein